MTAAAASSKTQSALTVYPKTAASGLGGSITVVVLYCLDAVWGITAPPEVAAAVTAIVSTLCAYLAPRAPA